MGWHRNVGTRFLIIVCLGLLPVSALSIWQGVERIRSDRDNASQTLRQSALDAASDELNVFVTAEKLLLALAKEDDVRLGKEGCERRLKDSILALPLFDNLTRIASDGKVLCAAVLPPRTFMVTALPWWQEALVRRGFFVSGPFRSPALHKDVFAGILPLTRADGAFDGTVHVAINIEWLTLVHVRQSNLPSGSLVAIFDKAGTIVASNAPSIATAVFAGTIGSPKRTDGMISASGPKDEAWSVSIAPVPHQDYYVGFAMKASDLSRLSYVSVAVDLLLPVLMIILVSLATWRATDRLVLRWIDVLSGTAATYGSGNYAPRPQALHDAPQEFRELGAAFSDMALAIRERDRDLNDGLRQKDLLIKEIHHRVKNTLQIVMSLLNLQSTRLRDSEAREALEQARARINAVSLANRAIYELDLDGSVDLKPLLCEAIEQVQRSDDDVHTNLTVSVDVVPCKVAADAAVPLILFVNEAMTNAYRHGYPVSHADGHISISVKPAGDGRMILVIADDGTGIEVDGMSKADAIGARLMAALARQLSGQMTVRTNDGGGTLVELRFTAHREPAAVQPA